MFGGATRFDACIATNLIFDCLKLEKIQFLRNYDQNLPDDVAPLK